MSRKPFLTEHLRLRLACTIFMSPEVACNRFYFVIVLVPLPFVFFMCSLPASDPLPSSHQPTQPNFLAFSFSVPSRPGFFTAPFSLVIHRPSSMLLCCSGAAHFWGQIGGLINQICHSNLGVRNFIFYFYNIFPSKKRNVHWVWCDAGGQEAKGPVKCVKTRKKYLEPFSMDSRLGSES